jgi:hypothetical protein
MEALKNPEEYIDHFVFLRRGRIRTQDAFWIEKREDGRLPGSGWYELHPFGIDLGTWDENEDALQGVDIAAWNAKALELVSEVRARERARNRKNVLYICSIAGPPLLVAGLLQNDASFNTAGAFFLVVAAFLWWQILAARLKTKK